MAQNVAAWIPVEHKPGLITLVSEASAVEFAAENGGRVYPMTSLTRQIDRSPAGSMDLVAKATAYGAETKVAGSVVIKAFKWGRKSDIAEEDLGDSIEDVVNDNIDGWNRAYAIGFDCACIGVIADQSDTEADGRPYTSIYNKLSAAGDDTFGGYTAGDNHATTATVTYANLSSTLGLVESGDFYDDAGMICFADPAQKQTLRGILDGQGRPIFLESAIGESVPDTILGVPVRWTRGARVCTDAGSPPAKAAGAAGSNGNSLFVFLNRRYLAVGKRSGPETQMRAPSQSETDEALQKWRTRRAFSLTAPGAAAVLEVTS